MFKQINFIADGRFYVNENGEVLNSFTNNIIKPYVSNKGYLIVDNLSYIDISLTFPSHVVGLKVNLIWTFHYLLNWTLSILLLLNSFNNISREQFLLIYLIPIFEK